MVAASGLGGPITMPANAQGFVIRNPEAAKQWLREKRDEEEYHDSRLEICE
jgi:hypothetical protein